jgi:hypothetical protein
MPTPNNGAILLLEDTSETTHKGIAFFQALLSHSRNGSCKMTHAGIYRDGNILESSGGGGMLQAIPLDAKDPHYTYQVYELAGGNTQLMTAAADWAQRYVEDCAKSLVPTGFGAYSKKGAAKSLLGSSSRGKGSTKARKTMVTDTVYYCSNFVAFAYDLACESLGVNPVLDVDYRKVSPKRLHNEVSKAQWRHVGMIRGGTFT